METAHVINRRKRKFDPFSVDEDNDNNEVENNMSLYRNEPLSDDISLNLNVNMSNGHSSLFGSDIETINKSRDGEEEEAIPRENNNEEVRSEAEERMLNGDKNGEGSADQEENNPGIEIQPKSSKKRSSIAQNYPLLSSCTCKIKCIEHVGEIKRNVIHAAFWKIESRDERLSWINGRIETKEVQVRRQPSKVASTKNRNVT